MITKLEAWYASFRYTRATFPELQFCATHQSQEGAATAMWSVAICLQYSYVYKMWMCQHSSSFSIKCPSLFQSLRTEGQQGCSFLPLPVKTHNWALLSDWLEWVTKRSIQSLLRNSLVGSEPLSVLSSLVPSADIPTWPLGKEIKMKVISFIW